MQGNWYHLVGLIIIVGFSVISWIYRQLKEQANKKKARDLIEERQREMLRTGRDPGAVAMQAESAEEDRRRQEIAARREAQLAELRRRAQMRQQQGAGAAPPVAAPTPPPVPQTLAPTHATASGRTLSSRGSMGPPPAQRVEQRPVYPAPAPRQQARPVQKPVRAKPTPRPQVRVEEPEETHRLVADEPAARKVAVVSAAPRTPEEWRRAIIANEILSPPLAVRTGEVPVPF